MSAFSRSRLRCSSSQGQGLTEFALVLPILILLMLGLFDLGRGVYAFHTIGNAAREGARIAIVNQIETSPDCTQVRPIENPADPHWSIKTCAANAALALGVQTGDVTVAYSAPPGTTLSCPSTPSPANPIQVGCIAHVTVVHTFTPITPVIGNLVGSIPMSSTSQIPVERVFP